MDILFGSQSQDFYTFQFKPGKDRCFKGVYFGNYFLIERKFSRKIYHCLGK